MIRGPDVSSVQGLVPWHDVAKIPDVKFAFVKCIQGNDGKDPYFDRNLWALQDEGLRPGAYHFVYPLEHISPEDWAQECFDACKGLGSRPGELPPVFDMEWPAPEDFGKWHCDPAQIRAWCKRALMRAETLWGRTPCVYSYPFWEQSVQTAADPDLARYPLHQADYTWAGKLPPPGWTPKVPAPWRAATFCQHDGNGGLTLPNGVDCDWNVFLGSEADWEAFLGLPTVAQAQECASG